MTVSAKHGRIQNMIKKIITIDILVMGIFFIYMFSSVYLFNRSFSSFERYVFTYLLIVMYIYGFAKCILGILLFIYEKRRKARIFSGRKYLLFLLPSFILILSYIYLVYIIIVDKDFSLLSFRYVLIPAISGGFSEFFASIDLNLLLNLLLVAGTIMWLAYCTLYVKSIRKINLLILNLVTPVNMIILFLLVLLRFGTV